MDIDIRKLCKSYFLERKEIRVLTDLSLTIKNADLISLTGPSGAGKSTFLHVLGTLDSPTSGSIIYDERPIHALSDAKIASFRNRHVGYVFHFHHLLAEFSALENVSMPLLMRREKHAFANEKAKEMLGYVGLFHRIHHKPGELSGGEQQRVALARSLVHEPSLLLADEPTGNLDEKTGQEIVELILRYNETFGTTVVLVTHNLRVSGVFKKRLSLTENGLIEDNF